MYNKSNAKKRIIIEIDHRKTMIKLTLILMLKLSSINRKFRLIYYQSKTYFLIIYAHTCYTDFKKDNSGHPVQM